VSPGYFCVKQQHPSKAPAILLAIMAAIVPITNSQWRVRAPRATATIALKAQIDQARNDIAEAFCPALGSTARSKLIDKQRFTVCRMPG
jgi:hypothetical protein